MASFDSSIAEATKAVSSHFLRLRKLLDQLEQQSLLEIKHQASVPTEDPNSKIVCSVQETKHFEDLLKPGIIIESSQAPKPTESKSHLISFDSKEGIELLQSSAPYTAAVGSLIRFRDLPRMKRYNAISASVAILNSLHIPPSEQDDDIYPFQEFTTNSFITREVSAIKSALQIQRVGITLEELAKMLNTFAPSNLDISMYSGVSSSSSSSSSSSTPSSAVLSSIDALRSLLTRALSDTESRVLVDYQRDTLGQGEGFHVSPLLAYNSAADSVLIFDVASYRRAPAWVPLSTLWAATIQLASAERGFIVVRRKDMHLIQRPASAAIELAPDLLPLDSEPGVQLLLLADGVAGVPSMVRFRETQRLQTYCGVASSINVLNSLSIVPGHPNPNIYPFNQLDISSFFTTRVLALKEPSQIQQEGIELDILGKMLHSFRGIDAQAYHADQPTKLEEGRRLIVAALNDAHSRVIVAFHRPTLGEKPGGGHYSPLLAYHSKSDSVLILEVASYKFPPVWVPMAKLWASMATEDSDTKRNRGFIIVKKTTDDTADSNY